MYKETASIKKSLLLLTIVFIITSCSFIPLQFDLSNKSEYKHIIGKDFYTSRELCLEIRPLKRRGSAIRKFPAYLSINGTNGVPVVKVKKGSKIIIDQIKEYREGGYTDRYAFGRIIMGEYAYFEFEYYMGLLGYGGYELPPLETKEGISIKLNEGK